MSSRHPRSFEEDFLRLDQECRREGSSPYGRTVPRWMASMQRKGYAARLHGDLLNTRIVDEVVYHFINP